MLFLILIGFLLAFPTAAQAGWQTAQLQQARETQIRSEHTGRRYRIQIARVGKAPPDGYPVLYVLDGDTFFAPALAFADTLMVNRTGRSNTPVLLVGIGYSGGRMLDLDQRAADLTPPLPENAGPQEGGKFGGADDFGRFIDQELKPLIASVAPVDSSRQAVFGHSYAGLFGAYSLFVKPSRFQFYVLSSPSVWWHNRRLLDFMPSGAESLPPVRLRITAGRLEQPENGTLRQQRRAMVENAQYFARWAGDRGMETEFFIYPDENHGSVAFRALQDGMRMLQRDWQYPVK